jgi:hypothetical protein
MTVGNLLNKVLLVPTIIAIFAYPIYLKIAEGVEFYTFNSFLHNLTVAVSTIISAVCFCIVFCYTVCNWDEDIRSWVSYKNLKFYIKKGQSNSKRNNYNY